MSTPIRMFYNPETNVLTSIQYRPEFGLYEVLRSDFTAVQLMSMERIKEKRGTEPWIFLGVI